MFSQSFPTHRTGCPKKTWTLFGAIKGETKKTVHPKFDTTLERERFVLGGCPSHRLLYS